MDRNDLLAAARAKFMQGFTTSLDSVIFSAAEHLFQKADEATSITDQSRLLDARGILLNLNVALRRQMLIALEQLLNRSFQTAYSTFRPSFGNSIINIQALSLVDSTAVEDELHIDSVTAQFRHAIEEELRDLNIRIALLFEQEDIRERENPFRPFLLARSILTALNDVQAPAELLPILSQQLADEMASCVRSIYEGLNALLAEHGIAAQLQLRIRKTPESSSVMRGGLSDNLDVGSAILPADSMPEMAEPEDHLDGDWVFMAKQREEELLNWVQNPDSVHSRQAARSRADMGGLGGGDAPVRRSWLSGVKEVGTALRNFFTHGGQNEEAFQAGASIFDDDDYSSYMRPATPLTESVHRLQQINTPQAAAMLRSDGKIRNLILERREELSQISNSDEEQMIIDIVAMLFEFILRDSQVPAEVRAQLGRLQFLVLKVALLDPALFAQKNHPARLLVNRIGTIVLGLQKLDPDGEKVTLEICRIVEALLSDITGDISLFSQMLDEFDAFVMTQLRSADQQMDRAVQALENAQNRTVQYAHINGMLSEALSRITIDAFMHDFLIDTWSRVLERAGRDDVARAKRLRVLVPDLVWSIVPKPADDVRKQLFGLIPVLLSSIKEGLALIGWSEPEQEELTDWLIEAHRHALRTGNQEVSVPPLSFFYEQFEDFINTPIEEVPEQASGWSHLDSKLLDEAIDEMETELSQLDRIFDLDMTELMGEIDAQTPQSDETPVWTEDNVTERLKSGVAIEILLDVEPVGARLTWVSQNAHSIVLAIDGVPNPTIVNVKVFRHLLDTSRVRFIEAEPLFERAVHSLLDSADELDHRVTNIMQPD